MNNSYTRKANIPTKFGHLIEYFSLFIKGGLFFNTVLQKSLRKVKEVLLHFFLTIILGINYEFKVVAEF